MTFEGVGWVILEKNNLQSKDEKKSYIEFLDIPEI